jgi:ATP-dependent exoDNAse (exonuclease V) beta subunit
MLVDAEKRSRVLDPTGSFHLTAPAGSGKTFLLVARFLRLLGLVEHPGQILALTFTNKAAAEMRERIRGCLERAKEGGSAERPEEAELLDYASQALAAHKGIEELLIAGEILQVRTFHSFCYAIATQAPFEAGITPGSTLMDENEQEFFLRETVNEALQQIASRKETDAVRQALMNRLLYLNNSWRSLAAEMQELVKRRSVLRDFAEALSRDRATGCIARRVRELAEKELAELRREFHACELGCGWNDFIEQEKNAGAEAVCALPDRIPGARWEDLPEWTCMAETFLTREGTVRIQFGPKTGFYSGFAKTRWGCAIKNIPAEFAEKLHRIRQLPSHDAPVADPDTLWDLVVLLHAVLEFYDTARRSKRALDYSSLELAAMRLFDAASPSDLQLNLDRQIRHILIDEFQDTNREQWELLQKLCSGWSDGDARTLFVVGDPKQSIYAFRNAEVKLFMEAALGVPIDGGGRVSLEPVELDTNFRSGPQLIDWCNRIFENTVMTQPKLEFDEVPFSPAKPPANEGRGSDVGRLRSEDGALAKGPGVPPPGIGHPASHTGTDIRQLMPDAGYPVELALFIEWPESRSARQREASWLAGRIAERGPSSQTAILLFSRTHLPVYLEALQEKKVPVQVKDGLMLRERPEVFYLWQLTRAIVFPHDDIAWATQLRSPWLNLDFDRIYAISREESPLWVEKIETFAERDEQSGLLNPALTEAWRHVGHSPLADVVESAWLDLEGARVALSRWGSRGLNCCRRFLQLLREAEQGEPVSTLARLEQLLQKAYEPVDPDTARSNIILSTVHGAKGLEFDAVFVPFMDWNPESQKKDRPPPYMLERSPVSGEYLLAPRPDRLMGERDPLYDRLRKLRSRRQLGEARRLFYVAVTRARHELFMSGLVRKKANSFSNSAESPLGWFEKHYGIDKLCGIDRIDRPEPAVDIDTGSDPAEAAGLMLESLLLGCKRSASADDGFFINLEPVLDLPPDPPETIKKGHIPEESDGQDTPLRALDLAGWPRDAYDRDFEGARPEFAPAHFEREKPPFWVISPSGQRVFGVSSESEPPLFKAGPVEQAEPGNIDDRVVPYPADCPPNVWGTLVHRLLADFGRTGTVPSDRRVSAFLSRIGTEGPASGEIAREAILEVSSCLADPWLQAFYGARRESRKVEWSAECAHGRDMLYSGVIDLAVEMEGKWRVVDFKTSRPLKTDDIEAFLQEEIELHRAQMLAYREICAKLTGAAFADIEVFIYWTALREKRAIPAERGD